MTRLRVPFLVVLLLLLGGCATLPSAQSTARPGRRQQRLPLRDAPGQAQWTRRRWSSLRSREGARAPPRFRMASSIPSRTESSGRRSGPPARCSRHHHRRIGRQLHRAGLRPLRRQAVRRYEQRFLKRDVQGEIVSRTFSPANWGKLTGGPGVAPSSRPSSTTSPVQQRDLRRSQPRQGPVDHGVGHGHLDRLPLRLQPAHLRRHLLGPERGPPVARRGGVVGGARRAPR